MTSIGPPVSSLVMLIEQVSMYQSLFLACFLVGQYGLTHLSESQENWWLSTSCTTSYMRMYFTKMVSSSHRIKLWELNCQTHPILKTTYLQLNSCFHNPNYKTMILVSTCEFMMLLPTFLLDGLFQVNLNKVFSKIPLAWLCLFNNKKTLIFQVNEK